MSDANVMNLTQRVTTERRVERAGVQRAAHYDWRNTPRPSFPPRPEPRMRRSSPFWPVAFGVASLVVAAVTMWQLYATLHVANVCGALS